MESKVCPGCKTEKPIDEFTKKKPGSKGLYEYCKECHSKRTSEFYYKHVEEKRLYNKMYRQKNKEYLAQKTKEYYEANHEKMLSYAKSYREENKQKRVEYLIDNHLSILIKSAIRRGKKKKLPHSEFEDLYNELLPIYQSGVCECCGRSLVFGIGRGVPKADSYTIDRIIPLNGYTTGNVAILCHKCNEVKNDTTWEETMMIANWQKIREEQIANSKDLLSHAQN